MHIESYLRKTACLLEQILSPSFCLPHMEGVALTLDDEHYLPQVWRNTKDKNVWQLTYCEKGSWQSMTFCKQGKIRATAWITEVTFANIHYWPGDNNQDIKSLIGLGREYVNVTSQTVLVNKRLAVRSLSLRCCNTQRLTQPSCSFLAGLHNCKISRNKYCSSNVKAKVRRKWLAQQCPFEIC